MRQQLLSLAGSIVLTIIAASCTKIESKPIIAKECWKCFVGRPGYAELDTNCTLGGRPLYHDSLNNPIPADCIRIE